MIVTEFSPTIISGLAVRSVCRGNLPLEQPRRVHRHLHAGDWFAGGDQDQTKEGLGLGQPAAADMRLIAAEEAPDVQLEALTEQNRQDRFSPASDEERRL